MSLIYISVIKLNAYTCNMDEQDDFIELYFITDLFFQITFRLPAQGVQGSVVLS